MGETCEGCGAPIKFDQIYCEYCGRPHKTPLGITSPSTSKFDVCTSIDIKGGKGNKSFIAYYIEEPLKVEMFDKNGNLVFKTDKLTKGDFKWDISQPNT